MKKVIFAICLVVLLIAGFDSARYLLKSEEPTLSGQTIHTGTLTVSSLVGCDTIDTNASGDLACGSDDSGSGGGALGDLSDVATSTASTNDVLVLQADGTFDLESQTGSGADMQWLGASDTWLYPSSTVGMIVSASSTITNLVVPDSLTGDLTGNADTATALAANPDDCAANQFADSIIASGNLGCNAIVDADVPDNITITEADPVWLADLIYTDNRFTSINASTTVTDNIVGYFSAACNAGEYMGDIADTGVFACTDASTEIDSIVATHLLVVATTDVTGHLTDTDWDTFNGKQADLGYTPVNAADWTTIDSYPAACTAGFYAHTIGDTLSCTDATTEIDSAIATHATDDNAHQELVTIAGEDYGSIVAATQVLTLANVDAANVDLTDAFSWTGLHDWSAEAIFTGGLRSNVANASTTNVGTLHIYTDFTTDDTGLVSNLNADQLDSQTGAYYSNWDNLTNRAATSTILALLDSDYRIADLHATTTEIDTLIVNTAITIPDPTDCSNNQFAHEIDTAGNLACLALVDNDVPDDITITEADPVWLADVIYTDHRFTTLNASTTGIDTLVVNTGITVPNPTDCAAGSYALGVDASLDAESCTDATTEINSVVNALGGTNLTCASQSCDVDDVFLAQAEWEATTTDALAEGSNLYYTDARVGEYVDASTTIQTIFGNSHAIMTITGEDYASLTAQQITFANVDAANVDLTDAFDWTDIHSWSLDGRFTGTLHATSTDFDALTVIGETSLNGNATTTGHHAFTDGTNGVIIETNSGTTTLNFF